MRFLAIVVVLVAGASYPSLGIEISQVECQHTLQKATEMIKRCRLPSFVDCCQLNTLIPSTRTGLYKISDVCPRKPKSPFLQVQVLSEKINVRCDMDTDGGGWIVIQRRISGGTINFTRNWEAYELGFGDLESEFWLGLRNIHCLTNREEVELRINMENANGTKATWISQTFRVDGPEDNYRLHIGLAGGTTGSNIIAYTVDNNNRTFSTYDRDNESNCGKSQRGGWWYGRCGRIFLNSPHGRHLSWYTGVSTWFYPSSVEMKVRPKACTHTVSPVAKKCT